MTPRNLSYSLGLPREIARKIYKTGQTRGADDDVIFQNRVLRNSTALIPLSSWAGGTILPPEGFENGYIVLAKPDEYFSANPPTVRPDLPPGLELGTKLLVFYETRAQWQEFPPENYGWQFATSRTPPLGGQYVARVPTTTREGDRRLRHGFVDAATGGQGAGIRAYEYASEATLEGTRFQLALLAWKTEGILDLAREAGTPDSAAIARRVEEHCTAQGLADRARLKEIRVLDERDRAICPLCVKPIAAIELASRIQQAEGRDVPDLTVTAANMFHFKELRMGQYNHRPYNLGWGHHHCNAVARDAGVEATLKWMEEVLRNNGRLT